MQTLDKLVCALPLLVPATLPLGCNKPAPPVQETSAAPSAPPPPTASAKETPKKPEVVVPDPKQYAWLGDQDRKMPEAKNTLAAAIPTPPEYRRIKLESGSFGAWLRNLPIAAPNTPVLNYRGGEVHPAGDDYVEAVIAMDVGKKDLQQTTDVILRFQAEWLWTQGKRDMTFKAATKDMLPYASYAEGKRILARGGHLFWVKKKEPNEPDDRGAFRNYLDVVFTWANSTAIRMQSNSVEAEEIQPGDFFMQRRKGGYSVIVLDIAEKPSGQRVALLGQSLYPAMNVYVARLGPATPWFNLKPPEPIITAHTKKLEWKDLRRLEIHSSEESGETDDKK